MNDQKSIGAKPYLVLIIAIGAASFASIFIKLTQQAGMPSYAVAASRMLLAALIVSPYVLTKHREELQNLSRRDLLLALFSGVWLALHFIFFIVALENTSVLIVMVFVNTGPIWTALLEIVFLKAKISRAMWLGIVIAISGGIFIALAEGDNINDSASLLQGIGLVLIAAIGSSAYLTIGRGIRHKVSIFPYIWLVFGTGGLVAWGFAALNGVSLSGHPIDAYFWLLMITLIPQLIGHSGFSYAVGYVSATTVALVSQTLSVTASILAFFILGELPTIGKIIGSAIIIIGVLVTILAPQLARQRKSQIRG